MHAKRGLGVRLLHESGLLKPLFPTLAEMPKQDQQAWLVLLDRLHAIEGDSLAVAFAMLLSGSVDVHRVREQGRSFRFTNKEIDRTAWLVENLAKIDEAASLPWPQLQRLLVHDGANDLLALATANWGAEHAGVKACRERLAWPAEKLNPQPLVTGDDLVAHGLRPGKYFGQLLDHIRDAQLEQQIDDQKQAFELVDKWLCSHPVE
jgi:poly(A) polymerase